MLDKECVILQLIGRLEGKHLTEIQKALAAETGDEKLVPDMMEVKLADQEAVTFLACCEASCTELRNCPTYIHEWIAGEKEKTEAPAKAGPE